MQKIWPSLKWALVAYLLVSLYPWVRLAAFMLYRDIFGWPQ
jgi:hypothetical protein